MAESTRRVKPPALASHRTFDERAAWSTWIYRLSLNVCMTLRKAHKRNRRAMEELRG